MKRRLYDQDHEDFRDAIRRFIADAVTPHFTEWVAAGQTPRDLFRKLGGLGVMGFGIPEEYGGPGVNSYRFQSVVSEECARAGVHLGHYAVSTGIVLPYILQLGTEDQKRRWLPGVASGDIVLCVAMTEPGTGSDLSAIRTTAVLSDDKTHYILNGAKTFITGVRNSELCLVAVKTPGQGESTDPRKSLSLLMVPTDSEGFEVGRRLEKLGTHSIDTSELSFTDVRVPVENLLGEEGKGFQYLGRNLPRERLAIGVDAVNMAQAAIDMTLEQVRDRTVFGQPVASFQNTKFVLAACQAEVDGLRAMVDRGIELDDDGELTAADAAKIKLVGSEIEGRVVDRCLQLFGGYGYMTEYPIARLYGDVRVHRIYGGTNEVMKVIISKDMGL